MLDAFAFGMALTHVDGPGVPYKLKVETSSAPWGFDGMALIWKWFVDGGT